MAKIDAFTEIVEEGSVAEVERACGDRGYINCGRTRDFRTDRPCRRAALTVAAKVRKEPGWNDERERRIAEHKRRVWAAIAKKAGLTADDCRRFLAYDGKDGAITRIAEAEGVSRQAVSISIRRTLGG